LGPGRPGGTAGPRRRPGRQVPVGRWILAQLGTMFATIQACRRIRQNWGSSRISGEFGYVCEIVSYASGSLVVRMFEMKSALAPAQTFVALCLGAQNVSCVALPWHVWHTSARPRPISMPGPGLRRARSVCQMCQARRTGRAQQQPR
jgi:hypothetical protein